MAITNENLTDSLNVYEEREDLRATFIQTISISFIIIGILLIGSASQSVASSWFLTMMPWVLLCVGSGFSLYFKKKQPAISGVLLTGIVPVAIGCQQVFVEYTPALSYLLLLSVIIGIGFLKEQYVVFLPLIPIVSTIAFDSYHNGVLWFATDTLYISILACATAAAGYGILDHARGMVTWAFDRQNKSFVRAESFYDQGEKLRKATYELERAKEQVEEISGAKSVFLSNMSHELRTPLNMVIGYTSSILDMPQMYENQEVPEVFRKDIELIKSSGEYLLTLINDILDLSKIESGKFEINPVAFDINPVLEGVMATALGLVKEKPIQLKPDFDSDLSLIHGDPMRIRQILLNLMSNAVKYTVSGSVVLSVKQQGDEIRIAVTDTGMGIPEETIATIFDRFEQVQNNSNIQGTGLGLDISQRLAEMHGSRINIESTVGAGSTFSFSLPLATEEQTAEFTGDETIHELTGIKRFDVAEPEAPESTWKTKRTVLIAEDDSTTRDLLLRTFEANNYKVFDVQDGDDVYDTASALLPQLIILDIVLPNRDGWTILDDLKADEETAHIPVIVLSAHIDDTDLRKEKAEMCLVKPINTHNILKHANQAIESHQRITMEA